MALEQAEQLCRAAGTVDSASRPILLYYGLNQASRALAAATVKHPERWRFESHGLKVNLSHASALTSGSVTTEGARRKDKPGRLVDAFQTLEGIFDCEPLPQGVSVGALWVALPDLRLQPLPHSNDAPPALEFSGGTASPTSYTATLFGLPASLAQAADPKQAVSEYLKHYPTLGTNSISPERSDLVPEVGGWGLVSATRTWAINGSTGADALNDRLPIAYWNRWWVLPGFPGNNKPTHPYLMWFALLYVLSMAARYHPEVWGAALDVDQSLEAVLLEQALDKASVAGPNLVLWALTELCGGTTQGRRLRPAWSR